MKCPKQLRTCPNGWTDCNLCAHDEACRAGTYTGELEDNELGDDLGIAIGDAGVAVQEITRSSPRGSSPQGSSPRGTWAERFSKMSEKERWSDIFRYHPPNLLEKEPITCMAGPTEPGGGGKCRVPKKPTKKIPEYLKLFGQQL